MRRIAVALALACVMLRACAGQSASAPTPTTASSSIAVSTAKSTTSASKPSTSKPTLPTTTAAPVPVNFSIKCYTGNDYATYQQAWAGKHTNYDCYETKKSGTEYTPQQLEAYKVGFDPIQGIDMDFRLGELYEMCASFGDVSVGGYFIYKEDQARQAMAELILCPDHPDAATIQASIDKFHGSQAAASSNSQAADAGIYAYVGKHLVGSEVQPGTWQSVGDKVQDCYWEISDASGDIIDNNFISVAPQFTINIPADAAGFTNTGCAFQRIGD